MSYCSHSRRRRCTVSDFKSWACAETDFMNTRCKFRHSRSIFRPRFPVRVQNFGDLATFSVNFCILYAECPPYFYVRFAWPTDLESIPHASTHTSIIPTKFEVDMTTHCQVIAQKLRNVTWPCDLHLWPLTLSSHVTNPATKFEGPVTIRSWVTSHNSSR